MKHEDSTLKVKQRVSDEQRRQVLDLRRRKSLREVAEATGLPLGTVKTLVSRSGAFRDNEQHRALFPLDRPITDETINTTYNNFYEFGSSKTISRAARALSSARGNSGSV